MEKQESKRLALLRTLHILAKYSDDTHHLKQDDILQYLYLDYGIEIERKAIGRIISLLKEAEYEIDSNREGSALICRDFEDSELRMLIDGVLSSRYINANHTKDLIEKLCGLSNIYFASHISNIYSIDEWSKTDNQTVFYSIGIIDDAIKNKNLIQFEYYMYGIDKKPHKTSFHVASPYQLILHNQKYFLMCYEEKWKNIAFYKLDHMQMVKIRENSVLTDIHTIKGYENGIDYKDLAVSRPYMFADKAIEVVFIAKQHLIDQIIEWFGQDIQVEKVGENSIKVTLKVSAEAMAHWALQYSVDVEIIAPLSLRQTIIEKLRLATKNYGI